MSSFKVRRDGSIIKVLPHHLSNAWDDVWRSTTLHPYSVNSDISLQQFWNFAIQQHRCMPSICYGTQFHTLRRSMDRELMCLWCHNTHPLRVKMLPSWGFSLAQWTHILEYTFPSKEKCALFVRNIFSSHLLSSFLADEEKIRKSTRCCCSPGWNTWMRWNL